MGRGLSLVELSFGLVLAVVLAGTVVAAAGRSVDLARARHVRRDMAAILAAARQYDARHGVWPASFVQLKQVLAPIEVQDPWGGAYVIGADERFFWIEADTPHEGLVRSSTGRMHAASARLVYEKRNVYGAP